MPDADLADLKRRLAATRWPDKETVADQSQGVQLAQLEELVAYWGRDYDWRKVEATLNALPQFMTRIDGTDIHFIHVRSRREERRQRQRGGARDVCRRKREAAHYAGRVRPR